MDSQVRQTVVLVALVNKGHQRVLQDMPSMSAVQDVAKEADG